MRYKKELLLRIIRIHSFLQTPRRKDSSPMYICICNAIRETDLRKAAHCCKGDAEATYATMGKRPNCGQCLDEAQEIIDAERAYVACEEFAV